MTTTNDLIERIQKYEGVEKFLILNKHGNKLNTETKEEEKHKGVNVFNNNYSDIPKLVDKATSVVRNIDPCVRSFILNIILIYYYVTFTLTLIKILYFLLYCYFLLNMIE